jgi:uncharacterized repeat protein (TIGR03803 family)
VHNKRVRWRRGSVASFTVESLECRQLLTATLTTLATFTTSDRGHPYGGLILSGNTLYGTNHDGGFGNDGTVFSVPVAGGTPTTLATFNGTNGAGPEDGMILSGNTLYGTTFSGGANNNGTVFSVPITGGSIKTLATFNGVNGSDPVAGLILSGGTLYGTTVYGGAKNYGTVFSVPVSGGSPTTLATFNSTNGSDPFGGLILSGQTLYGTTSTGGLDQDGTVFSLPVTGGSPTTLATFNFTNGQYPSAQLTLSGNTLYGTTYYGGSHNDGTVFSLPLTGGSPTTLASFNFYATGANPQAGLILSGKTLYGTTEKGGFDSVGTVFSIPVTGGSPSSLITFNSSNGANPEAGLIADSLGNLYSTTSGGTSGVVGSVFKVSGTGFVVPVSITAVAPSAQTAIAGTAKSFTLGSFTEAGATGPYVVDVSWGDGTVDTKFNVSSAGKITPQSHTFAKAATDTVKITLTDAKAHKSNTATFKVTVAPVVNTASISGTVFNDANANQKFDPTELGLDGWQVYIDTNKDGKYDTGDLMATTNINGSFSFTKLAAGTYEIRIVQVTGTKTTTALPRAVTVLASEAINGILFGEERVS